MARASKVMELFGRLVAVNTMHDLGIWSLNLGRFGGVRVRVHMFFLLFAAFALYLGWQADAAAHSQTHRSLLLAALGLGILAVSVVAHEMGHLHAALYFGGSLDQMVIGPLGGMCPLRAPRNPRHELLAHLAGPLVNLAVAVGGLTLLALFSVTGSSTASITVPWGLLNPLDPQGIGSGSLSQDCLRLAVWVNWMLFLLNLLPAYPFDGSRLVRSGLSLVWEHGSRRQAARAVGWLATITALGLLVASGCLLAFSGSGQRIVPVWFALAMLGIFLLFSARLEEERRDTLGEDDRFLEYDFSEGYTSLERTTDPAHEEERGPFLQWLEERRATRQRRQREKEQEDEQRVDEILARLHAQGMESLSADDKALLQRVSARYRSRINGA